jgi:hypothetical protein
MKKMKSNSKDRSGSDARAQADDSGREAPGDWRGEMLARIRKLIHEADPEVVEEVKWRKASNPAGVPVWSHEGIICTGETYKDKVKLTFLKGAALADPAGLFNSSLEGNARRAIDLFAGDAVDAKAFTAVVRAAVKLNVAARGQVRAAEASAGVGTRLALLTGKMPVAPCALRTRVSEW